MIKGFYAAASAMLANLERQNVLTHNITNLDTPGFKQILVSMDEFSTTEVFRMENSPVSLGRLGLGVETTPEETDFAQGPLELTGQSFDLAIDGEGFFAIQTPDGTRYTRDGRFMLDALNQVATVDGNLLLDANGNTITIDEGDMLVSPTGVVSVNGTELTTIELAVFEDPKTELVRDTFNSYIAEGGVTGTDSGIIQQGVVEISNVDIAQVMTKMVTVSRAYEAAQQLVQTQDTLLGRVVQSLGRF